MLFAKTPGDLNKMLNQLVSKSEWNLNPEKTKVKTNWNKSSINVGKSRIGYVENMYFMDSLYHPKITN